MAGAGVDGSGRFTSPTRISIGPSISCGRSGRAGTMAGPSDALLESLRRAKRQERRRGVRRRPIG